MRYLAEICSIKTVETIVYKEQTYDKVQKYSLNENAYEFIAAKGFNVGDKVVFIGEGSLIPSSNKDFEFLRTKCYNAKFDAFRVKPIRMCGFISMGLLMPLSILPKKNWNVGDDATKDLEIRKYEPQEDASPTTNKKHFKQFMFKHFNWLARIIWKRHTNGGSDFPTWLISKTDENNIENVIGELEKWKDSSWYTSSKMEGQSSTFFIDRRKSLFKTVEKLVCCSRNIAYYSKVDNNYWNIAENLGLEKIIKDWNIKHKQNIAIQGEICGPGIQDNIYKYKTLKLFVFNVKDLNTMKYFNYEELLEFAKETGLTLVPILDSGIKLSDFVTQETVNDVRENLVEKLSFIPNEEEQTIKIEVTDKKIDNKKRFHCEGIVLRTQNQSFSCKFKSKEYALWFSGKEIE